MALILPSAQRGLSLATWLLRTSGRRTAASAFSVSLDLCFQSRTGTLSYVSPSRDPPFHIFKRIQLGLPGMGGMVGGSEWRKESKGLTHSFHFLRFFFFFDVDHFKSLYWICYHTVSVLCFGFWLQGTWNLSSLTRDSTCTAWTGRRRLNHWTTREVLGLTDS